MQLSSIFRKKRKGTYIAVLDLGSGSVGGALVWYPPADGENQKPEVRFSYRLPISISGDISFSEYVRRLERTITDVLTVLSRRHPGRISALHCFLSVAWYVSQTRSIQYSKRSPFTFSNRLANNLIQKDIKQFTDQYISAEGYEEELTPIEQKTMQVRLNGYPLDDPFERKASNVEISVLVSASPVEAIESIRRAAERLYPHTEVQFHTFGFASYACLRDLFDEVEDYLLVDVGHTLSDVSVVKDGILRESHAFPFGIDALIQSVADALNTGLDEARSMVALYITNSVDDVQKKKLEPVFKKAEARWVKEFQKAVGDVCCDVAVPPTVFLTTDPAFAEWFTGVIKGEEFHQQLLSEKEYTVIPVTARTLHQYITYRDTIPKDPFITLESIFINRFIR